MNNKKKDCDQFYFFPSWHKVQHIQTISILIISILTNRNLAHCDRNKVANANNCYCGDNSFRDQTTLKV